MNIPSEELSREIEAAFSWRPHPGDDKAIAVRRSSGVEGESAWRFFGGKHWQEILRSPHDIEVRDNMGLLTFEGFVYYLPAFLTLSLDVDEYFEVGDQLVSSLWSFPEEVSSLLKPAERRAVVHVLQHLSEAYEKMRLPRLRERRIRGPGPLLGLLYR